MANLGALKGAFDAKIGKVPVVAVGVPLIILAVVASRFIGKKSSASDTSGDTSQPTFFAKDVPDTWAAVDPSTGIGHSPDGTITYIPTDGSDPTIPGTATGPTPSPTPAPTPAPSPPGTLSAHQRHLAHEAHLQHLATAGAQQSTPTHVLSPPATPVGPSPVVAGTPTLSAHQLHEQHVAHVEHVAHVAATKKK